MGYGAFCPVLDKNYILYKTAKAAPGSTSSPFGEIDEP